MEKLLPYFLGFSDQLYCSICERQRAKHQVRMASTVVHMRCAVCTQSVIWCKFRVFFKWVQVRKIKQQISWKGARNMAKSETTCYCMRVFPTSSLPFASRFVKVGLRKIKIAKILTYRAFAKYSLTKICSHTVCSCYVQYVCRRDAPKSTSLGEASKSLQHGFLGLLWLYTRDWPISTEYNTSQTPLLVEIYSIHLLLMFDTWLRFFHTSQKIKNFRRFGSLQLPSSVGLMFFTCIYT